MFVGGGGSGFGCIAGLFKIGAFRNGVCANPPYGSGGSKIMWGHAKPLYGRSTPCEDRYLTLGYFLANDCRGKATALDKSVSFWDQPGFSYES